MPVHIYGICTAVAIWLSDPNAVSQIVAAVGAEANGMLDGFRQHGAPSRIASSVPALLVTMAARIGDHLPANLLCSDTLTMLAAGNTADASGFAKLLERSSESYLAFIA